MPCPGLRTLEGLPVRARHFYSRSYLKLRGLLLNALLARISVQIGIGDYRGKMEKQNKNLWDGLENKFWPQQWRL